MGSTRAMVHVLVLMLPGNVEGGVVIARDAGHGGAVVLAQVGHVEVRHEWQSLERVELDERNWRPGRVGQDRIIFSHRVNRATTKAEACHRRWPRLQRRIPDRATLGNCLFGTGRGAMVSLRYWLPVISAVSNALRIIVPIAHSLRNGRQARVDLAHCRRAFCACATLTSILSAPSLDSTAIGQSRRPTCFCEPVSP